MKIAIIGSGVSGLTVAHMLHKQHDITLYESSNYIGGHVNTIDVEENGSMISIDTGFIVFNDWTYPHFQNLLKELNVAVQNSEMSFATRCEDSNYEWSGNGLRSIVFNKKNWYQIKSYQLTKDILRFNRIASQWLMAGTQDLSLGEFLAKYKFSKTFVDYYILPMGAAIWSCVPEQVRIFPAYTFLLFFKNHGLLNIKNRPQWKTVTGGAKNYVAKLIEPFRHRIFTNTKVLNVKRVAGRIELFTKGREPEYFDHVFFACHSDQVINLLEAPTAEESRILSSIKYQENIAVLHNDENMMPRSKSLWSSWNYIIPKGETKRVAVSYYMNRLQRLQSNNNYIVTLNKEGAIKSNRIIKTIRYSHPVFNSDAIAAQKNYSLINGVNNTWYCGAYWRYGFHEDGVWSARRTVKHFNSSIENEQLYIRRAG